MKLRKYKAGDSVKVSDFYTPMHASFGTIVASGPGDFEGMEVIFMENSEDKTCWCAAPLHDAHPANKWPFECHWRPGWYREVALDSAGSKKINTDKPYPELAYPVPDEIWKDTLDSLLESLESSA